jgi:hypothetical protein
MAASTGFFAGSVCKLHQGGLLDLTVIHGEGKTTAAKKGGNNLGYSGHKHPSATRWSPFAIAAAT